MQIGITLIAGGVVEMRHRHLKQAIGDRLVPRRRKFGEGVDRALKLLHGVFGADGAGLDLRSEIGFGGTVMQLSRQRRRDVLVAVRRVEQIGQAGHVRLMMRSGIGFDVADRMGGIDRAGVELRRCGRRAHLDQVDVQWGVLLRRSVVRSGRNRDRNNGWRHERRPHHRRQNMLVLERRCGRGAACDLIELLHGQLVALLGSSGSCCLNVRLFRATWVWPSSWSATLTSPQRLRSQALK